MSEEILEGYGLRQKGGFFGGLFLLAALLLLPAPAEMPLAAWRTTAVVALMSVWWITEAVPIPATALLPLALFPLLGASSMKEAAEPYADPVIFLFMGGFMVALAAQKWHLHRRIALNIVYRFSATPSGIILGFSIATAFISMWVSNTATALMVFPIGLSVVQLSTGDLESRNDSGKKPDKTGNPFATALMLAITYASSIGGMGTLIGTPPNALCAGFIAKTYNRQIEFIEWMLVGVPLMLVLLAVMWVLLTKVLFTVSSAPADAQGGASKAVVVDELKKLGKMSTGEWIVSAVFILTALLWIFNPLLTDSFPALKLTDAGIAMAGALVLFLIPINFSKGEFVLDWQTASRLPWGVILLFGGGFALSSTIEKSGLAKWIAAAASGLTVLPVWLIILMMLTGIVFFSEIASNTATVATFLPIVNSIAVGFGLNPYVLIIPATFAGSCGFMLPVATPPNAIAYASGYISIRQMARAGIILNLISIAAILVLAYTLVPIVFAK